MMEKLLNYNISSSYLVGVSTAKLQWHPSSMKVIKQIKQTIFVDE